jgi:hypothetical protein
MFNCFITIKDADSFVQWQVKALSFSYTFDLNTL